MVAWIRYKRHSSHQRLKLFLTDMERLTGERETGGRERETDGRERETDGRERETGGRERETGGRERETDGIYVNSP